MSFVLAVTLVATAAGAPPAPAAKAAPPPAPKKASPPPAPAASEPPPAAPVAEAKPAPADAPLAPAAPATSAPVPAKVAAPKRVVVLDPQLIGEGTSARMATAFGQAVGAELGKLAGYRVTTAADLRDMLGLERQKQLVGCDSTDCMAELAGAIDVDELVSLRVSHAGKQETVTLARMNGRTNVAIASATKTIETAGGEELLALVGPLVGEAFQGVTLREGRTRGVDTAQLRQLIPPPLPRWVFFTAAGVAVVAAAGAGVVGWQASTVTAERNQLVASATASAPADGAKVRQLEDQANQDARLCNGLLIGAGAVAVTAGVLSLFTNFNPQGPAVAVAPTSGGAMFAASGSF